jgi:hypothetical protein
VRWTEAIGFADLPPMRVRYSDVNGFRIADGMLAEAWDLWDRLTMWQHLSAARGAGDGGPLRVTQAQVNGTGE